MQKYTQGKTFNDRNSQVFEALSPEAILKELGIGYSKENIRAVEELQDKELKLQRLLDGGDTFIVLTDGRADYIPASTYKVPRSNTKLRNEVYDFLNKKITLDYSIQELQNQSTKDMGPLDKDALKKEIENLTTQLESHMENGDLAVKMQEKVDKASDQELKKSKEQDLQDQIDFPLVTSKGEVTSEYLSETKFVERLKEEGIEASAEDVGVTLSDGTLVYNETKMKEIKDFSVQSHEKFGHAVFFDTFKDSEGLITEDGIKFIDEMLAILPDSQKKEIIDEVASRYPELVVKDKKFFYEENLGVMAEYMRDGKIKYEKSIGEKIKDVVPFYKDKGFDNLDIQNPADAFKLMQGAIIGKSGAKKRLSETSIEEAGKKLTEQSESEKVFEQSSKLSKAKLTPKQDQLAQDKVKEIQELQEEANELTKKYKRYKKDSEGNTLIDKEGNPVLDPIKSAKQQRLEKELAEQIKPTIDSFVESRTKALYDPITADKSKQFS